MPTKRYNTEEIIHKLREADVLLSQGRTASEVCKSWESQSKPTIDGASSMAA